MYVSRSRDHNTASDPPAQTRRGGPSDEDGGPGAGVQGIESESGADETEIHTSNSGTPVVRGKHSVRQNEALTAVDARLHKRAGNSMCGRSSAALTEA